MLVHDSTILLLLNEIHTNQLKYNLYYYLLVHMHFLIIKYRHLIIIEILFIIFIYINMKIVFIIKFLIRNKIFML